MGADVADVIRVLVLFMGGITLGLAVFVLRLYVIATRIVRRNPRTYGALPYHVALVAASHSLLVLAQMMAVGTRLFDEKGDKIVWWGSPIGLVAFTCSIIGLIQVLQFQQTRIQRVLKQRREE